MKRRIVEQGSCTLMVSLPKAWSRKVDIKKGDDIHIEEVGGSLLLSPQRVAEKRLTSINFTRHAESAIRVVIINAYRAGYDTLHVHFKDDVQFQIICRVLQEYLIGFEVTAQAKTNCRIENITEPAQEQFDVLFRKVLYNTTLMIENTQQRLEGTALFADYAFVMLKIHRYDNFCRRVIAKHKIQSGRANFFWNFLSILIHAPRELYHLNRYLDSMPIIIKDAKMLGALQEIFSLLSDAYIKKDTSKLERIHEIEKDVLFGHAYASMAAGGKKNAVFHHLASAIRNLHFASSPLCGLIIESDA